MIFVFALIYFIVMSFSKLSNRLEFDKEEYILFLDGYLNLVKSINMCKRKDDIMSLVNKDFVLFRNRFKKSVPKYVLRDKMGRLYSHAYNAIQKRN